MNRYDVVCNTFKEHADSRNTTPSRVLIWGNIEDGVLVVREATGRDRYLTALNQWQSFDDRDKHRMTPVTGGTRYSAVLYDRARR